MSRGPEAIDRQPGGEGGTAADVPRFELHQFRSRACQNCARSKTRCEWLIEPRANACNRCAKIKADCVVLQLTTRKRRGPSTRVRKLEDKLDGIMSLLGAAGTGLPRPGTRGDTQQLHEAHSSTQSPLTTPSPMIIPETQAQPEAIQIVPGFALTFLEADAILNLYRTSYSPYFPFVPIPVTATAAELEKVSPFLLRTIIQVAAPQTASVLKSVDRWFRQQCANRIIVEQERRLELLQALLVFIAWGDFQFYIESQATDLLHLASTLVLDLGLYKASNPLGTGRQSFLPDAIRHVKGSTKYGHTLEDMRAMLGFVYLTSVVSTLFQRIGSPTFTSHTSHCCDVLISAQEHDSDKFLVALVRLQRVLGRLSNMKALPSMDSDATLLSMDVSVQMVLATARKELDAIVHSQPPEVQQNVLFWTQYHGILMKLYEPALSMRPTPNSTNPRQSAAHTEALSSCLQAAVDFFDAYSNIPLESLGHMPLMATAYMAFAFVTSSRILMLNDGDWDVNLARRTFDFPAACQTLSDRFRQADSLAESLGQRWKFKDADFKTVLSAYSTKILWVRRWYLVKVSAAGAGVGQRRNGPETATSSTGIDGTSGSLLGVHPMTAHELDDAFWDALLDPEANQSWHL